jgi:hypothetical protein
MSEVNMRVSELIKILADGMVSGSISIDQEVRIHTGWEGPEHLQCEVERVCPENGEEPYMLLRQPARKPRK